MTGRKYEDSCGVARALDLIGERWALLVVRELLLGPKRFTDLRAGLPAASPNVLSQRLRELDDAGVIRRRHLPAPAASRVYELTEWGRELEPVVLGLARWGSRAPVADHPGASLGVDSIVLGVRTFFVLDGGEGWEATYELRLGDDRFTVRVRRGEVDVSRGEAHAPDATIATDPATFLAILNKTQSLSDATKRRDATVTGSRALVERLLHAISVPIPVRSS